MASRPNDHIYRGPSNNHQIPPGGYPLPRTNQSQHVRPTPSLDTGDDYDGAQGRYTAESRAFRTTSNASIQQQELFMGPSSPRVATSNIGGTYQRRVSPPLPPLPIDQPLYNPQEYARTPLPPTPQAYNSPSPIYNTSYQPYVPAAYQATNVSQPSSYGTQHFTSSYGSPIMAHSSQSPPLPSRLYEQPYGNQRQPQVGASSIYQYSHQQPETSYRSLQSLQTSNSPALPSRPSVYTPPAPPPPPFSPNRDAFPSNIPPHAPTRSYSYSNPSPRSPTASQLSGRQSSHQQIPSLPNYQADVNRMRQSTSPRPSPGISLPSTPGPTPPQHSPQRMNTVGRHPQARPLPGPPPDSSSEIDYFDRRNGATTPSEEIYGYDDAMQEAEAAVMGRSINPGISGRSPPFERINYRAPINEEEEPQPLFSPSSHMNITPDTDYAHTNGAEISDRRVDDHNNDYSDESDAEAAAGLAAMQMAEEQEAAEESRRQSSSTFVSRNTGSQRDSQRENAQSGLYNNNDDLVDMESYGGGLPGHYDYRYGDQPVNQNSHPTSRTNLSDFRDDNQYYAPAERRSNLPNDPFTMDSTNFYMSDDETIFPFPTIGARVDTGDTGGLSEPSSHPRRLSFEDGDEATLVDSENGDHSSSASSLRESIRKASPYPPRSASRPLPRVPAPANSEYNRQRQQTDQFGRPVYPLAPDEYPQSYSALGTAVQKANSIGSHSTTPHVMPPGRSVTDAEQRRRQQQLIGSRTSPSSDANTGSDASILSPGKLGDIDLPAIPPGRRKKFIPGKLSSNDYKRCTEPWALSSILAWIKEMTEGEADLKEHLIFDGIVQLFTHKVPTMNTADAETLSTQILDAMFKADALIREEEWVKFGQEPMGGVLYQLTGTGCYSPRVHTSTIPGRCYSHNCMRTLKKINLQTHVLEPERKSADWMTFFKVKKEDVEKVSNKEIQRQNNLHEIVQTEDTYMDQINVLLTLYRDGLANSAQDSIISHKKIDGFLKNVFGKVEAIKVVNEEHLLAQLKYCQEEQGPWISGFASIFRQWIRMAKQAYIEYAANFPNATLLVRREVEENVYFRQFLDQVQLNVRSNRLPWDSYLKAPITRLQRYGLLLSTVHKNTIQDSEEKHNLQTAIEEIKVVTLECDSRVAEMSKHADLFDLAYRLKLRKEMDHVKLNLTHLGREVIFQGDLQRRGNNKVSWLDTHAILFDHYLVLAKPDQTRDIGGQRRVYYDVSKLPIPMDLLVLESSNDDPVIKGTVKGISSVSAVSRSQTPQDSKFARTISNQSGTGGPGTLVHSNTNSSTISNGTTGTNRGIVPSTILDSPSPNEKILYPFRIKHLGKSDLYVLYSSTAQNRQDWCDKIIEAKTRHATSLFAQNAEPFRLRVMADTAFAYDGLSGGPKSTVIRGTPLDRAIRNVEKQFDGSRPSPICRAQVNCATTFNQPYGKQMIAVGTDYGVYISDYNNPRGWTRAIASTRVTQVAVLEEFSLFLIIADKSLIAYHLDSVCPVSGTPNAANESSSRHAPQKLSGSRDVGFFATGRMKERALVFYKKREGISSIFKVLEPVYQKSAIPTRSRFGLKKGTTDFFRDFDELYIPSETYAINLFSSSLAIATARGFEVMTLDKKSPFSIPDLKLPSCASIATRIRDQKPLGMFRLSDSEFLLVFEEVGIYVDKHGDISRSVVMEFVGRAKQAVLYGSIYLVLVDIGSGFVEVRNAINGRLRQVVSGRDVRLLDDGAHGGTVKICMQHPELERCQVVLEMIVNEGLKE